MFYNIEAPVKYLQILFKPKILSEGLHDPIIDVKIELRRQRNHMSWTYVEAERNKILFLTK